MAENMERTVRSVRQWAAKGLAIIDGGDVIQFHEEQLQRSMLT